MPHMFRLGRALRRAGARHLLSRAGIDYTVRRIALSVGVLAVTAACCCAGAGAPVPPTVVGQVTIGAPDPVAYDAALYGFDCGFGVDSGGHGGFTASLLVPAQTPRYRLLVSHPDAGFGADDVTVVDLVNPRTFTAAKPAALVVQGDLVINFTGWRLTAPDGSAMVVGGDVSCPQPDWAHYSPAQVALTASGEYSAPVTSIRLKECGRRAGGGAWVVTAYLPAQRPRYFLSIIVLSFQKPGTFSDSQKPHSLSVDLHDEDNSGPMRSWQGDGVVTVLPDGTTLRLDKFDYSLGGRRLSLSGTLPCPSP